MKEPLLKKENKREIETRQQLKEALEPGEELLTYTGGAIVGIVNNRPLHLGLTQKRLILLPLKRGKPSGQVLSIWREHIAALKWSGLWDRLKIELAQS